MDKNTTRPILPFTFTYTAQLAAMLKKLKFSIAITTYQAGKVIFISPLDDITFTSLPRSFSKPMGMDIVGDKLVIATKDEVILFENSKDLAKHYPAKQNTYDTLYIPRITFYTGNVDMHDIAFGTDGIWAINTSFSCLCKVNGNFNFVPVWKPPFISALVSEDRCHLNGLVLKEGKPKYVTGLGQTDTAKGWKDQIVTGGFLMDIETNECLLENLPMPHSPLLYKGDLYLLLSASSELIKVNVQSKTYEVIIKLDGFCRGLDIQNDLVIIGVSKIRKSSSTFEKLSFSETIDFAGLKFFHLPTKSLVGDINYQCNVEEIYEVKIMADTQRPNIMNTTDPLHKHSLAIPGQTFWKDSINQ